MNYVFIGNYIVFLKAPSFISIARISTKTKLAVQCWLEYGRRRSWVPADMHVMREHAQKQRLA